jgi:hypothetical protein
VETVTALLDALRWLFVIHHRVPVECECEGGDGEGYPGYYCGCRPERDRLNAAGKRNRAQLRRYVARLLARQEENDDNA